ncbi:glycoside hydrolase family 88/105 protein [Salipaludibacillus sp. CF4.18]|uniref:glycoside hydrolase family 88/105 protein n=1 Tax=Salipaludibacillus sp. CF4.18 TaxID=3373081 RepID=UPI003EE6E3B2
METYIDLNESIYSKLTDDVAEMLTTIAGRYIGDNPPHPVVYRAFNKSGLTRLLDYRYDLDFSEKFPGCKDGQYIYAWAKIWQDDEADFMFALNCYGPVQVYLNDELVYRSTIVEELDPKRRSGFKLTLKKGWNHFLLRFMKTTSGIGGIFGTGSFKRHPMHFLSPLKEKEGQEGWVFTEPLNAPVSELDSVNWFPKEEPDQALQMARMFGEQNNNYAIAWTKIKNTSFEQKEITLSGRCKGALEIFINEIVVFKADASRSFHLAIDLPFGVSDVLVKSTCLTENWGFHLETTQEGVEFELPYPVKGANDHWLFVGPFDRNQVLDLNTLKSMDSLKEGADSRIFWRLNQPNTWVRPYLENRLFGKWDYPLGVTLYGLIETGKELQRGDIIKYVIKHMETSTALYKYSLWDKDEYGAAGINNQLSAIDSLDDCGSFGATMLLSEETAQIKDATHIADDIVNHITNIQDRLADGTLYRRFGSVDFMKDTIWCDDLYMSTPFLCRYYKKTGDPSYLEDAVHQFLQYKKYLYIPELKIMSHVYDFKFDTATNVPWGRGNGWVLFSLSELLAVLPESHDKRNELLTFFRELSEGFTRLQGENGMWHQVLTDQESYEETSCTSMFVCAFSRGIRHGWLKNKEHYVQSVYRGWEGMAKRAIDKQGNVYGVCQGSGYSFTGDYYKNDLTWILNDTHGTGIVLLAGIETMKLKKALENSNNDEPSKWKNEVV